MLVYYHLQQQDVYISSKKLNASFYYWSYLIRIIKRIPITVVNSEIENPFYLLWFPTVESFPGGFSRPYSSWDSKARFPVIMSTFHCFIRSKSIYLSLILTQKRDLEIKGSFSGCPQNKTKQNPISWPQCIIQPSHFQQILPTRWPGLRCLSLCRSHRPWIKQKSPKPSCFLLHVCIWCNTFEDPSYANSTAHKNPKR